MNKVIVTRLGDVKAGDIQRESQGTEINDPIPIVLWSHGVPATVLYYTMKQDLSGSKAKQIQKISKLQFPEAGVSSKLKSAFSAYPITVLETFTSEADERLMDEIQADAIMTADIDGDGTDELIVPRNFGGIDVYSTAKHLFGFKPPEVDRKLYDLLIADVHKYALKDSEGVLYAFNRSPVGDLSYFKEKDLKRHQSSPNYLLVKVDRSGANPVYLDTPGGKIEELLAVGVCNLPGSEKLDEIVACYKLEGQKEILFSRHQADGAIIGQARKVYVEVGSEATFVYLPHSAQMVMFDYAKHQLYFVSPDKSANWMRRLDLRQLLKADEDIEFLNIVPQSAGLLALVRHQEKIYALDQESMFSIWHEGKLVPQKEHLPLITIQKESALHEIVGVIPAKNDSSTYMTIQSRPQQFKELSDEQIKQAGTKYLGEQRQFICAYDLEKISKLSPYAKSQAIDYCEEKGVICPELHSMDDLKNKLPEVYKQCVHKAQQDYLMCLRTLLYAPIESDLDKLQESDSYNHLDEYRLWLKNAYLPSQLTIGLWDLKGQLVASHSVDNIAFLKEQSNLSQFELDRFRYNRERGQAVMSLQKSGLGQSKEQFYYWIQW
ncbi:MAG: hypothetical protein M0036_26705 [Desulfobacteraceae bacterium]|nr:hypothetical protein [Desulfobacteraceae bacterium]